MNAVNVAPLANKTWRVGGQVNVDRNANASAPVVVVLTKRPLFGGPAAISHQPLLRDFERAFG
jgi:hypothetical protein